MSIGYNAFWCRLIHHHNAKLRKRILQAVANAWDKDNPMKTVPIVLIALGAAGTAWGQIAPTSLDCRPEKTFVCGPEGCSALKPDLLSIRFHADEWIYERCDAKGCARRGALVQGGGIYIIASTPGHYFKFSNDLTFVDSASLGMTVIINYGTCRMVPPRQ